MGEVYEAEDVRLGRTVALKLLAPGVARDPVSRSRFEREARAASRLDHPNVGVVYEIGETDLGAPFIAMARYTGCTLRDKLTDGPLGVDEAVAVVGGVAAGLGAAHRAGVVHRDVKPENVIVTEDGTAKVIDFGVAKLSGAATLTQADEVTGTAYYMSPEQAGGGEADARADVWALGVVLYEALAGRRPFAGDYASAVLYAVVYETPTPLDALRPGVPQRVVEVVDRCLLKDPADRYPDAAAVARALASEPASGRPVLRPGGRGRALRAAALAAGVALAALGAVGALRSGAVPTATDGLPDDVHLAVLPPTLTSDMPDVRALSAGAAEVVASGLAERVGSDRTVRVVPVSEVVAEGVRTAAEAHRVFRVDYVVTGLELQQPESVIVWSLVGVGTGSPETIATERTPGGGDGLREHALEAVAKLLGLGPAVHEAQETGGNREYLEGLGYLRRDRRLTDLSRATALLKRSVESDPGFARAHARLAEALVLTYAATRDSSLVGRARREADRALSLDDADHVVRVARSAVFRTVGEGPQAVREALRARNLAPGSPDALVALARAREMNGEGPLAEASFQEAIEAGPHAWLARAELGDYYFRQGQYAASADEYREVTLLVPENQRGHVGLGSALQQIGDLQGAEAAYADALELGDHPQALANLGTIFLGERRFAEAADRYRQAISVDSTNHVLWSLLSNALDGLGDERGRRAALRAAARAAEAALDVNPQYARAHAGLALYLEALGTRGPALDHARRAVALANGDVQVHFQGGYALELLGRRSEALVQFKEAARGGYPLDYLLTDDDMAPLREDPGFAAIARLGRGG